VDIESRADMQITNGARKGDLNHRTFPDKIPFQMFFVARKGLSRLQGGDRKS
jgi:hypothetical protein